MLFARSLPEPAAGGLATQRDFPMTCILMPKSGAELLVALALALRCEAGDIQLIDNRSVADLINALENRAA
jgi:hypothetical protein